VVSCNTIVEKFDSAAGLTDLFSHRGTIIERAIALTSMALFELISEISDSNFRPKFHHEIEGAPRGPPGFSDTLVYE